MIMVAGTIAIILTVPLFGGRFSRLESLRLVWGWTILVSLALQILVIGLLERVLPRAVASGLHLVSYGLAAAFLWANRRTQGVWVVALGGLLNVIPIVANGGVMPARAGALAAAGKHVRPDQFDNSTVVAGAKVAFLGDVFVWPAPLPLANVFSIGDVMLTAGVGVVLHGACGSRLGRRRQPSSGLHALPFDRPATVAPFAPPAVGLVITAAGFVGRSCPLGGAGSSAHRARRAQSSPGLRITSAAGSPL